MAEDQRRNCTGFPPYGCDDDSATLPAARISLRSGCAHMLLVTGVTITRAAVRRGGGAANLRAARLP